LLKELLSDAQKRYLAPCCPEKLPTSPGEPWSLFRGYYSRFLESQNVTGGMEINGYLG
jgi:hypothetical protein